METINLVLSMDRRTAISLKDAISVNDSTNLDEISEQLGRALDHVSEREQSNTLEALLINTRNLILYDRVVNVIRNGAISVARNANGKEYLYIVLGNDNYDAVRIDTSLTESYHLRYKRECPRSLDGG